MTKLQYINDAAGKPQFVVLPVAEYERLLSDSDGWEDVPYTVGSDDDVTVPDEVVSIMVAEECSLLSAWRTYRGLSQYYVAEQLNSTQSAISQMEMVGSKPQRKTREKLAAIYGCRPEQLIL